MWASLVVQLVKNLPAIQETRVQLLDGEDSLEKEMSTHSSVLAWQISWIEEPDMVHGVTRVGHDLVSKPPLPPPSQCLDYCSFMS